MPVLVEPPAVPLDVPVPVDAPDGIGGWLSAWRDAVVGAGALVGAGAIEGAGALVDAGGIATAVLEAAEELGVGAALDCAA